MHLWLVLHMYCHYNFSNYPPPHPPNKRPLPKNLKIKYTCKLAFNKKLYFRTFLTSTVEFTVTCKIFIMKYSTSTFMNPFVMAKHTFRLKRQLYLIYYNLTFPLLLFQSIHFTWISKNFTRLLLLYFSLLTPTSNITPSQFILFWLSNHLPLVSCLKKSRYHGNWNNHCQCLNNN